MIWDGIINGMYQAIGFVIITTIFSILSWFALKRFIIKQITEVWHTVKKQGLEVNLKLDKNDKKKPR